MENHRLIHWAIEQGDEVTIEMSYRILLHDTSSLYWIDSGEVDLFILSPTGFLAEKNNQFFVRMSEKNNIFFGDMLSGPLQFITNFQRLDFVFPFALETGSGESKIVLKANTKTILKKFLFLVFSKPAKEMKSCFRLLKRLWKIGSLSSLCHLLNFPLRTLQ